MGHWIRLLSEHQGKQFFFLYRRMKSSYIFSRGTKPLRLGKHSSNGRNEHPICVILLGPLSRPEQIRGSRPSLTPDRAATKTRWSLYTASGKCLHKEQGELALFLFPVYEGVWVLSVKRKRKKQKKIKRGILPSDHMALTRYSILTQV